MMNMSSKESHLKEKTAVDNVVELVTMLKHASVVELLLLTSMMIMQKIILKILEQGYRLRIFVCRPPIIKMNLI